MGDEYGDWTKDYKSYMMNLGGYENHKPQRSWFGRRMDELRSATRQPGWWPMLITQWIGLFAGVHVLIFWPLSIAVLCGTNLLVGNHRTKKAIREREYQASLKQEEERHLWLKTAEGRWATEQVNAYLETRDPLPLEHFEAEIAKEQADAEALKKAEEDAMKALYDAPKFQNHEEDMTYVKAIAFGNDYDNGYGHSYAVQTCARATCHQPRFDGKSLCQYHHAEYVILTSNQQYDKAYYSMLDRDLDRLDKKYDLLENTYDEY